MRFRTTVELGGKTATGLRVPAEVVEALGAGSGPPSGSTSARTPTAARSRRAAASTCYR